jgi:hypothetical protein
MVFIILKQDTVWKLKTYVYFISIVFNKIIYAKNDKIKTEH